MIRLRHIVAALFVAGLAALALWAPPDGHEHAQLAQFVGRFHPLVVHLPIALLLLVPILELFGRNERHIHLRHAAGVVLVLAAISAVFATGLGWLLAWSGGYRGPLVTRHLWGGLSLSIACLICCWLRRDGPQRRGYPLALLGTVLLMAWTSHQGASITHGTTYLTKYMPAPMRRWFRLPPAGGGQGGTFYAVRVQPILDDNCVTCHNPDKKKGDLLLDSYASLLKGGKHGAVIKAGRPAASPLFARITLPQSDKHFMPTDGKTPLSPEAIKVIELWIKAGASPTLALDAIKGAPSTLPAPIIVLAPDYHPRLVEIKALETSLGIWLLPRSQIATDGLVLRTASAPDRCDDAALARLKPIADLIVDAELARTRVTDAGLASIAGWSNLRLLDLSHTAVTSRGLASLGHLGKIESLNLTETSVDPAGIAQLHRLPSLKHIYSFDLKGGTAQIPVHPPPQT